MDREKFSAKFWLSPISLARNIGFKAHELTKIQKLVVEHQAEITEA